MTLARLFRSRQLWLGLFVASVSFSASTQGVAQGWLPWEWPEREVTTSNNRNSGQTVPTASYTDGGFNDHTNFTHLAGQALANGLYYRAWELYNASAAEGDETGRLGAAISQAWLGNLPAAQQQLQGSWQNRNLARAAEAYSTELNRLAPPALTPPQNTNNLPFYRIGLLLPLSGQLAPLGNDLMAAAQLALFESGNRQLVLYPEDAGNTPQAAEEAVQRLLRLGVDAIVGPLLSTQVDAVAPFARSAGVPVLAFSNDARVSGINTYTLGDAPQQQLRAAINAAYQQGQRNFAALVPASDDGAALAQVVTTAVTAAGATLTRVVTYPADVNDITPHLKQLLQVDKAAAEMAAEREKLEADYVLLGEAMADADLARLEELRNAEPTALIDFDALLLPVPPSRLPLLMAQLAFYDVNPNTVALYGLGSLHHQNRDIDDLAGILYPLSEPASSRFDESFVRAYGRSPQRPAYLGHAAIELLNDALILADNRPKGVPETLHAYSFNTAAGALRLTPGGHVLRSYGLYSYGRRPQAIIQRPGYQPPALPRLLLETRPRFRFDDF